MARATRSRGTASAARRGSVKEQLRQRAADRELARIRKLLELDDTAYSDLYVLIRARQVLNELEADDQLSELEEYELLEGEND